MKVKELTAGMLIRPTSGMRWVWRLGTLNVEPGHKRILNNLSRNPIPMGHGPAMYIVYKTNTQRQAEGLDGWGARIVMLSGKLMPVDSSAWHKIEKVENE